MDDLDKSKVKVDGNLVFQNNPQAGPVLLIYEKDSRLNQDSNPGFQLYALAL